MFAMRSMKECMTILLLSDEIYDEWGEILLMWEQGKILDGFKKLPLKPQPIKKSAFNCLVGLKDSRMQKLVNGLKVHEITMHDHLASGKNTHMLTMVEFTIM